MHAVQNFSLSRRIVCLLEVRIDCELKSVKGSWYAIHQLTWVLATAEGTNPCNIRFPCCPIDGNFLTPQGRRFKCLMHVSEVLGSYHIVSAQTVYPTPMRRYGSYYVGWHGHEGETLDVLDGEALRNSRPTLWLEVLRSLRIQCLHLLRSGSAALKVSSVWHTWPWSVMNRKLRLAIPFAYLCASLHVQSIRLLTLDKRVQHKVPVWAHFDILVSPFH